MKNLLIIPVLFFMTNAFAQGNKHVTLSNGADLQIDILNDTTFIVDPVTGETKTRVTSLLIPAKLDDQPIVKYENLDKEPTVIGTNKTLDAYYTTAIASIFNQDPTYRDELMDIIINEKGEIVRYEYSSIDVTKLKTDNTGSVIANNTNPEAKKKHDDAVQKKIDQLMAKIKVTPGTKDNVAVPFQF